MSEEQMKLWYVAFRRARGDSWVITKTTLDLDDADDLVEWIRLEEESRGENIVLVFWKRLNQKGHDEN